jgi:hypothetical protein
MRRGCCERKSNELENRSPTVYLYYSSTATARGRKALRSPLLDSRLSARSLLLRNFAGGEASPFVSESGKSPSHGGNTGSNPVRDANQINELRAPVASHTRIVRNIYGIAVPERS